MASIRRAIRRLLSSVRSGRAEAELAREIESHLRLLEDRFLAQGMSAREARSAARRAFGGVEQVKEHQRDARSFRALDAWWLDLKLGARMLVKYPGLALVGGLGMAVATAIAVGGFTAIHTILDPELGQDQAMLRLVAAGLGVLTLSVVLLSAAGIYALMSFTVAKRRKEIGIRAALGANPRRILASIFARATGQLAAGAVLGVLAAVSLDRASNGDLMEGHAPVVLPIVAVLMLLVGLLAALGPARRGLRIAPTEALRSE